MDSRVPALVRQLVLVTEKLHKHGDAALAMAKDQQSPLRARRYDTGTPGGSRTGTIHDPTCDVGSARRDKQTLYDSFDKALQDLDDCLVRVDNLCGKIVGTADLSQLKARARRPGAGHCVACGEWMPGSRKDRIINGFCPTHNSGFHEAHRRGVERPDYIAKTRRRLNYDGRHH